MTPKERLEQEIIKVLNGYSRKAILISKDHKKKHIKANEELISVVSKIYQNEWAFTDFNKYGRSKKIKEQITEIINALYADQKTIITQILKSEYMDKTASQINLLNQQGFLKSIQKNFDAKTAINQANGGVYWFDRLGKNRQDTLYRLSNAINSGLYNGVSYSEMTKNLKSIFGDDLVKNETIARTESRRVTSVAQTDVCDSVKDKIDLVKTWRTMQDERVRHKKGGGNHVKMNGITIPYDNDFVTPSGSKGKAPHQLVGPKSAGDNCNCRCIMLVKVK